MFLNLEIMGVASFFKKVLRIIQRYLFKRKNASSSLLKVFCYLESIIRVFIRWNESPESPQLDIELAIS